jgi:acyl-coenzyme A thioesterase PaaI-like protein
MESEIKKLVLQRGDNTDHCYVCGQANPHGLRIAFLPDGTNGSRASYTARSEHDGWPGVLHGGLAFALMDEALAWALFFQGLRGVTARAQTSFRQPIRTGTPVVVRGWMVERHRKLITARAEVRTDDAASSLMAEMDATMFLLAENAPRNLVIE